MALTGHMIYLKLSDRLKLKGGVNYAGFSFIGSGSGCLITSMWSSLPSLPLCLGLKKLFCQDAAAVLIERHLLSRSKK